VVRPEQSVRYNNSVPNKHKQSGISTELAYIDVHHHSSHDNRCICCFFCLWMGTGLSCGCSYGGYCHRGSRIWNFFSKNCITQTIIECLGWSYHIGKNSIGEDSQTTQRIAILKIEVSYINKNYPNAFFQSWCVDGSGCWTHIRNSSLRLLFGILVRLSLCMGIKRMP